jgi:hypothetical protein
MTKISTIPELIIFIQDNKITDIKTINTMVKNLCGQGFFFPLLFKDDGTHTPEYFIKWLHKHQDKINKGQELPFFIDLEPDFKITDIYGKKSV